jgi:hypothetical protein
MQEGEGEPHKARPAETTGGALLHLPLPLLFPSPVQAQKCKGFSRANGSRRVAFGTGVGSNVFAGTRAEGESKLETNVKAVGG